METVMTVRLDGDTRDVFSEKCKGVGLSQNKGLLSLIERVNSGEIVLRNPLVENLKDTTPSIDNEQLKSLIESNEQLKQEIESLKSAIALDIENEGREGEAKPPLRKRVEEIVDICCSEYYEVILNFELQEIVERKVNDKISALKTMVVDCDNRLTLVQESMESLETQTGKDFEDYVKNSVAPLKGRLRTLEKDFCEWRVATAQSQKEKSSSVGEAIEKKSQGAIALSDHEKQKRFEELISPLPVGVALEKKHKQQLCEALSVVAEKPITPNNLSIVANRQAQKHSYFAPPDWVWEYLEAWNRNEGVIKEDGVEKKAHWKIKRLK